MERIQKWHTTKQGLLISFVIELAGVYLFASLAINDGSLWLYLITIAFLIGSLHDLVKVLWKVINDN